MPPKKAAAPEKKAILGRPSNNLKIGIVGVFHAITSSDRILTIFKVFQMSESRRSSTSFLIRVCG
jgi:hypothetical protein